VNSSGGTNEYDDESKTNQGSNFEGIYIDDSSEKEVGLYVLEAIPKVGTLFQTDQKVRGVDDQPTPCVLIKGKIMEHVNKIQLGLDFHLEKRRQYEDLLRKYIHLFVFSYKDLKEITME